MAEKMTNADNFWLCMDEPTNLMVITAFMEFNEPVDFKRLQATIDSRLASFPRFQMRVARPKSGVGLPVWERDPHYDPRSHVQRVALPSPGDKNDLQEMISNLSITPLDFNKPLWQIHLIENYGEGCVIFFRIHHAIADGIALIHVLLSATDSEPDAPWPDSKPRSRKQMPRFNSLLPFIPAAESLGNSLKSTQKLGKEAIQEIEKMASDPEYLKKMVRMTGRFPSDFTKVLAKHAVMSSDPNTPFKGKLGVRKLVTWTHPMDLSKIKTVGKAITTTTLNDVLIATVTGAMRRYLKTRHVAVNELDLRVAVPVNIRKPGKAFELGNKFSLVFLQLPVYLEDPILRLKEVKRRMDELKKSPDPYINFVLLNAIGYFPPGMAQKVAQLFANKASGVMTNVPGPQKPLYFSGSKIENIMFWVPRSGIVGLGISILSYDGKVTVGIASDEKLMPDPEVLLEGFEEEFNYLLELVQSGKIYEEPLVLHDRYKEAQTVAGNPDAAEQSATSDPWISGEDDGRCRALTKSGNRCRKASVAGTGYCNIHMEQEDEISQIKDVAQLMKELIE